MIPPHRKPLVQRLIRSAEAGILRLEKAATEHGRKRIHALLYLSRVAFHVVHQWFRDRCPQQAASLAFQTVLSMVPILAVALWALRATGSMDAQSSFVNFVATNLVPVSTEKISALLVSSTQNITFESVGGLGLGVTVLLAFIMFNNLERTVNIIWRSEARRSVAQKFIVFYFAVTVGPFLTGLSLVKAAQVGLTSGIGGFFISLLSIFALTFMANLFLPRCKVKLLPALIGAALTTALFEIAKYGFKAYVTIALDNFSGAVYGAVAVLPLWMLWIYYTWLMLLFGFEVARAVQNLDLLDRIERRERLPIEVELTERVNGVMAARVMVAISEAYVSGDKVVAPEQLTDRFDVSPEVIQRLATRLRKSDLIVEVDGELIGYIPARPPSSIRLDDVLAVFRTSDVNGLGQDSSSRTPLDELLTDVQEQAKQRIGDITLADLVPSPK